MKKIFVAALLFICCSMGFSQEQKEKFIYSFEGRRDPFIPLVTQQGFLVSFTSKGDFKDIRLEGIIYDEHSDSYAIINDNVVKSGDTIVDMMILKIEKDKVFISKDGQILVIELEDEDENI